MERLKRWFANKDYEDRVVEVDPDDFGPPAMAADEVATPWAREMEPGIHREDDGSRYLILDLDNDPVARRALRSYINGLEKHGTDSFIIDELRQELQDLDGQ